MSFSICQYNFKNDAKLIIKRFSKNIYFNIMLYIFCNNYPSYITYFKYIIEIVK